MARDTDILEKLKAGDQAALAVLFDLYINKLYTLALKMLHDQAESEDIVQETFLKVLTSIGTFDARSGLGTWLYRITYNSCIDRLRQQGKEELFFETTQDADEVEIILPKSFVEWHTPELMLIDTEGHAALENYVENLPEPLRVVFILRDINELSGAEAAEVLGISVGSVKVRLHRARLILRENLATYFEEVKLPKR